MKKNNIMLFVALILAACQTAPSAAPESTASTLPQETATATQTEIPPSTTPSPAETSMPETVKISLTDGMTQLYIPAGTFIMGGLDVYQESDELPAHGIYLNAFWIDQVEVTNGMYNLCVQTGLCRPPARISSDNRLEYFGNPEFQDYPVVHIAWYDANAYCQWAGRRLPTEAEWEHAARGDDKRNYPWGDELPNEYNSNSVNIVGDTSRVGSYAEGASPFGVLDMAGNVWEWVADRYKPNYYKISPAENPAGPTQETVFNNLRVLRGGSYQDDGIILRLANRSFLAGPNPLTQPTDEAYYGRSSVKIGFRCANDN